VNLAVNAIFGPTFQGEGRLGDPCFFLRLWGCNLHCRFCDTPYTWDTTGRNGVAYSPHTESHLLEVAEVYDRLVGLSYQSAHIKRLVISGGEPLLQQRALLSLTALLHEAGWYTELETAGTIVPIVELVKQFNVSPKLANSGNPIDLRLNPAALHALSVSNRALFKFVVCEPDDLIEIDNLVDLYHLRPVYLMPEGTTTDALNQRGPWVAEAALQRGYCYSPRLHIELYGNARNK
jgi:7-carboxy-7-deazaguanine synthase